MRLMAPEHREKRDAVRKWLQFWITIIAVPAYGLIIWSLDVRTERTIRRMDYITRQEWSLKWDAHDREVTQILNSMRAASDAQSMRITSLENNREILNGLAVKVGKVEAAVDDIRESLRTINARIENRQYKSN